MNKKQIYKPRPISGFPEWLPQVRRVEQQWMDRIREMFESYGYCSIETPSVEALDVINAKGGDGGADVDKEVYVIERLHKEEGSKKEARLALHFDQTVPLARYVAQHFNELTFPFKRYQMQRVWRGERPQAGRFREFYQCDIDVINIDNLPLHFDAEMPAIIWEILSSLPGMENEKINLRISNRKILIGLLDDLTIENKVDVTRWIDKLDKLDANLIKNEIRQLGVGDADIDKIMQLVSLKTRNPQEIIDHVAAISQSEAISEGAKELAFVMENLAHLPDGAAVADLAIVRGLDYYTGTVYETVFTDDPSYGSICSGGRYDDLAGNYINKHLPGVGISIGFSRLFDRLRIANKLGADRVSPADILVVMPSEELRGLTAKTAQQLRARGLKVEQYHNPQKIGKQMGYAEKKGIPFVWFPPFDDDGAHEVKNMATKEQEQADPDTWDTP